MYFWKISVHWYPFVLIGFIWQVISLLLTLLTPESPRWLVNRKRVDEAKSTFQRIAKWNGKEFYWDVALFRKHSCGSIVSANPRGS